MWSGCDGEVIVVTSESEWLKCNNVDYYIPQVIPLATSRACGQRTVSRHCFTGDTIVIDCQCHSIQTQCGISSR